jgi:hypothetical protein
MAAKRNRDGLTAKETKIVSKKSRLFDSNTQGIGLPQKSSKATIKAAQKNSNQSAKTKRSASEVSTTATRKANSEKLKLALRESKSPGRGPIISNQPVTNKTVPEKQRQASEAKMTQYNKNVKQLVKSYNTKASDDAVVAKNKSGGKKPFSKGTYGPTGPKVPVKPRGGLRGGGGLGGGGGMNRTNR